MKINSRSPYYINHTISSSDVTSVRLNVWIYTGTQTTSRPTDATYVLESTPINSQVSFQISDLVKDYFNISHSSSEILWVDYRIDEYNSNTSSWVDGLTTTQLEGFYGYGYFEDGVNPQINDAILLSANHIVRNENESIRVPYNNNKGVGSIWLMLDSSFIQTQSLSASTDSSGVVGYITQNSEINKIIFSSDGQSIKVSSYCETKHNPYKITFINKYGVLEDVWFFKNSKLDINIETEGFKRNIISSGSYSINDHQYHTLRKQGRETITLNSGFYPEASNETFRQLLLSDYVWLHYNSQVLPVQIKDSSFNFKTRLTDRVINYTMQFEFAFDKLNSVR